MASMGFSPADHSHVVIVATTQTDSAYVKLLWRCAGCGDIHACKVRGTAFPDEPCWEWNGSLTAPTLAPSVLKSKGEGPPCHSFVRDGIVEFLGDCAHSLAGQRVAMVPENADPFRGFGRTRADPDVD